MTKRSGRKKPVGWQRDKIRHSLASRGIKTSFQQHNVTDIQSDIKDWAKDSKYIIEGYHGSPYEFTEFLTPEESGIQSGVYMLSGLSFAPSKELAEPFSRQYPADWHNRRNYLNDEYKRKINELNCEYTPKEIDLIRRNIPNFSGNESIEVIRILLEHFSEDDKNQVYKTLYKGYKRIEPEINKIDNWYEEEKEKIEKEFEDFGSIYKVYIKANNIIEKVGEDIGFENIRDEIINELEDDEVLIIRNADTGQYIGDELITTNPKNIYIEELVQ